MPKQSRSLRSDMRNVVSNRVVMRRRLQLGQRSRRRDIDGDGPRNPADRSIDLEADAMERSPPPGMTRRYLGGRYDGALSLTARTTRFRGHWTRRTVFASDQCFSSE